MHPGAAKSAETTRRLSLPPRFLRFLRASAVNIAFLCASASNNSLPLSKPAFPLTVRPLDRAAVTAAALVPVLLRFLGVLKVFAFVFVFLGVSAPPR